jgi:hypothetical protein
MLRKAIERETELLRWYEDLTGVCDYPDVQSFLSDSVKRHQKMIEEISEKLGQMEVRGQVLDGIISSFDPAGV